MADALVPPYRNNPDAPIVYFDIVAANGVMNGAVQIELAGRTLSPKGASDVTVEIATTARLRCSPAAAVALRNALDSSLKMLETAAETQSAAAQKLN